MGRKTIILLLAAASAIAQDLPLIRGSGTSLETFEVDLRLDAVDHATAEGLARSFARFEEEQHDVRRSFADLVREAHLDILRRFYTKDLVDRQAKDYESVVQKGYRSEVKGVTVEGDKATAQLQRTYIVGGKQREEATEIDLVRDGARWRIAAIRDRGRDGQFKERPLGTPPEMKRAPVPSPAAPDLSSPKAAVTSLRDEVLRFGGLRDNAALSLTDRFFDICAAFYGDEVAKKAREERPRPKESPPVSFDVGEPAPRLSDLMRVDITVNEDVRGKRTAIGQAAFDLRSEDGKWRVVGEYLRPDPDTPPSPVPRNFGLFFLVRR